MTQETKTLAEKIAGFPRVRLCQNVDGSPRFDDYLLSEPDRFLIVRALRQYRADGEADVEPKR